MSPASAELIARHLRRAPPQIGRRDYPRKEEGAEELPPEVALHPHLVSDVDTLAESELQLANHRRVDLRAAAESRIELVEDFPTERKRQPADQQLLVAVMPNVDELAFANGQPTNSGAVLPEGLVANRWTLHGSLGCLKGHRTSLLLGSLGIATERYYITKILKSNTVA